MAKNPRCAPNVRAQAIDQLLKQDGGVENIRKLAQAVVDNGDDMLGLNTMVRQSFEPNWAGAVMQIRINGLLSSPKTHLVNAIGNKMVAAMAIPERFMTAGFSRAFHGGEVEFGEALSQSHGFVRGMFDGMRLLRKGAEAKSDSQVGDLFDVFRPTEETYHDHLVPELVGQDNGTAIGRGLAYAGKALNVPTAMLGKADDYFKAVGYRMELHALAHRQARAEGLEGEAFASRMADIINDPPEDLKVQAFETARYQTFTNDLGPQGQKIQSAINSNYALKFVFPFVRTPTNILKYTFERTPVALLSRQIRADIRAGGARAAQAEARIALGSMLLMMGGQLALSDRITGGGSMSRNQQRIAKQTGWQPYSIRIGDKYYAYNRLEPLGMMLGLGADIAEMSGGLDVEENESVIMAASIAMAQNLASKTYLSGAFDLMAALDPYNAQGSLDRYIVDQSFTFAPFSSLVRTAARGVDPVARDGRAQEETPEAQLIMEFVNSFKRNIPGLSDDLPPRRDIWGQEINMQSGMGRLYDMVSPIATRTIDPDAVDQVILDNEIPVSWPTRQIEGVKLTPEQYSRFSQMAGEFAKEQLDGLVGSNQFKNLSDGPDGMKSQIVQRVITQSRKRARQMMKIEFPQIQEKIVLNKQEKAKNLTGAQ